jgi:hypothetical protein
VNKFVESIACESSALIFIETNNKTKYMEKVFVLVRMWDKVTRGHETVERIASDIDPILDYVKRFSYVSTNPIIEMDENFDMDGICKKNNEEEIRNYFAASEKRISQHFIKVWGHKFDDPEEDVEYVMYRLQIRNIH